MEQPLQTQNVLPQKNELPQIILNQPGADLINRLLDAVLKGGGLSNLTLVKEVLTVTNRPPSPPQEVEKPTPIEKKLPDEKKPVQFSSSKKE